MAPERNVSIRALRPPTRKELSAALNPAMVILTKSGKARYWYGLMGLCKIGPQHDSELHQHADPTGHVLQLWYESDPQHSTIHQLLLFLEEIDRFDVIEDVTELIDADIRVYEELQEGAAAARRPDLGADRYIITTEDVTRISDGRPLEVYDAFLLYDHDDIEFAIQLLETMEREHGMRFCAKDRDLVGGGLELDKMIKVITERCNRLIVILSDAFFRSQANQYYLSFAHAYGIERERKIIPCTYKECTLPADMRYLFILDYRRMMYYDFWGKLKKSIEAPGAPPGGLLEKSRVNRSHSDNGQTLRSAIHEGCAVATTNGLKPVSREVKFSSTGNLRELEPQLNPGGSSDELRKKPGFFKKFLHKSHLRKDQSKGKKKRAEAVAN